MTFWEHLYQSFASISLHLSIVVLDMSVRKVSRLREHRQLLASRRRSDFAWWVWECFSKSCAGNSGGQGNRLPTSDGHENIFGGVTRAEKLKNGIGLGWGNRCDEMLRPDRSLAMNKDNNGDISCIYCVSSI